MKSFFLIISSFLICTLSFKILPSLSNPIGTKYQPALESLDDEAFKSTIDKIVHDEMVKQNLPGVAIGAIEDGKVKYVQGYGYTSIDKKTKVTTNTIFRWASISKPLTAVAALQLEEKSIDGSLNKNFRLSHKVTRHVNYWTKSKTNRHSKVTVEHLLLNNSGIQHYGDGVDDEDIYDYDSSVYKSDKDGYNGSKAVAVFKNAKLDFPPGDKYLYSTFGFNLLGAVVEEVAPSGYVDWVKENIGKKSGMTSLRVAKTKRMGYRKLCDGRLTTKSVGDVEWKLPGGGWESNIKDLAKFAVGLIDGRYLKNTSKLWSKKAVGHDNYHYGINKAGSGNSLRLFHGGSHSNLKTLLHVYPNKKYGVVVMCYADWANCTRIAAHIYDGYFGRSWNQSHDPFDKCGSVEESCQGKLAAVWRKTGKDVIIRRGYSHDNFYTEWSYLRSQGYYCDDFEAYTEKGKLRWDGIFRKGSGGNAMWRNFDFNGFKKKWEEESKKGNRLVDLETYVVNGKRRWAGLFRPGSGAYAMWRNQTHDNFAKKRTEMTGKGMKLIDIEVYEKSKKLYWSGVWVKGKEGKLNRNYSHDEFNKLWKDRRAKGYKLVDIERYKSNGKVRWAGIWEKDSKDDRLNRNFGYCGLMDKHDAWSKDGFEMLDLGRY